MGAQLKNRANAKSRVVARSKRNQQFRAGERIIHSPPHRNRQTVHTL